ELERVARDLRDVEISLDRPSSHALAARLRDRAEIDRVAGRDLVAELLRELAPRGRERILVLAVLALRDRPRSRVLVRPERTAHVREQHLDLAPACSSEQEHSR